MNKKTKAEGRESKKKPRMSVSGKSVLKLKKIIEKKSLTKKKTTHSHIDF